MNSTQGSQAIFGNDTQINIDELRKVIYPNFFDSNLGFYYKENRSIEERNNLSPAYVAFYQGYDSYNASIVKDLEDFEYVEDDLMYIFRFYLDDEDLDLIDDEYPYYLPVFLKDLSKLDEYIGYMLCEDNFPKRLNYNPLDGEDINSMTDEYYPKLRRDIYQCITSTSEYRYDSILVDMLEEQNPDFDYEWSYKCIRFIVHDRGVDVEFNSSRSDYHYDKYKIYLFAIPPSFIPYDRTIDMLVSVFKDQFNINLPFNINYHSNNM